MAQVHVDGLPNLQQVSKPATIAWTRTDSHVVDDNTSQSVERSPYIMGVDTSATTSWIASLQKGSEMYQKHHTHDPTMRQCQ